MLGIAAISRDPPQGGVERRLQAEQERDPEQHSRRHASDRAPASDRRQEQTSTHRHGNRREVVVLEEQVEEQVRDAEDRKYGGPGPEKGPPAERSCP